MASAEWGWGEVEAEAVRPYGPGLFWACANALYRQVALKYLALALLHLGALPPRQPGARFRGPGLAAVLRVWVLALLDPRQSKVQVRGVLPVALGGETGLSAAKARPAPQVGTKGALTSTHTTPTTPTNRRS